jgi:hypothetical protein
MHMEGVNLRLVFLYRILLEGLLKTTRNYRKMPFKCPELRNLANLHTLVLLYIVACCVCKLGGRCFPLVQLVQFWSWSNRYHSVMSSLQPSGETVRETERSLEAVFLCAVIP